MTAHEVLNGILLVGLLAVGSFTLVILHKVRRVHTLMFSAATVSDCKNLYRQLEALHALHLELGLSRPLPALGEFAASPDFARELLKLFKSTRPNSVLELGSGVSTLVLALTMQQLGYGHVCSLDHDAEYADRTRSLLREWQVEKFATVIHAPLVEHRVNNRRCRWYSLHPLAGMRFDALVVDGPPASTQKNARYPALPLLQEFLVDNAMVIMDDTSRSDEKEALSAWKAEFPEYDQRLLRCEKGCALLTKRQ